MFRGRASWLRVCSPVGQESILPADLKSACLVAFDWLETGRQDKILLH
jgi:hypothetical protein